MPKTATDYSECVIYKICCRDPSVTYEYYGHTTNKTSRKKEHKTRCNNENDKHYNCKVYSVIRENGGWDNWQFIVVEDYPCENINDATLRERYWIELKQSQLNIRIPIRTTEEREQMMSEIKKKYYKLNRELVLEKNKKYHDENIEQITEYQKEYNIKNKEKLSEYRKKYREENKNMMSEKIICECGSEIARHSMTKHRKSQRHINYLNQTQANENDGA